MVERDDTVIRAFKDDVLAHFGQPLIDVRSPEEYSGERTEIPGYPTESALRAGHIPSAASVPWARAAAPDATFKRRADLEAIYLGEAGLKAGDDVIAYCRIGNAPPHLVRAHPPARIRERAQLRRIVDRVGQRRAGAHRTGEASPARSRRRKIAV